MHDALLKMEEAAFEVRISRPYFLYTRRFIFRHEYFKFLCVLRGLYSLPF